MGKLSDGIRGHLRGEGECGEREEGGEGRGWGGGVERGRGSRKVAREEECVCVLALMSFYFE